MFTNCQKLINIGNPNMNGMFLHAFFFNQPLNQWDVSNVTNMTNMFWGASYFSQNISNWNLSEEKRKIMF